MYRIDCLFGCEIWSKTIGSAWVDLIGAIVQGGKTAYDEGRERLALDNVHIRVERLHSPDAIIHEYGNQINLQQMIEFMFSNPNIIDVDKTPSFMAPSKSYFQRIKEGHMMEFIVKRLTQIPESKKAVMIFPTYEDYDQVLRNPTDDYLPCLVSLQFRLIPKSKGYQLNTIAFFRSIDAFQKAHGNFESIGMLTEDIRNKLLESENPKLSSIEIAYFDIFITDAHIYANTLTEVHSMLARYNSQK